MTAPTSPISPSAPSCAAGLPANSPAAVTESQQERLLDLRDEYARHDRDMDCERC